MKDDLDLKLSNTILAEIHTGFDHVTVKGHIFGNQKIISNTFQCN